MLTILFNQFRSEVATCRSVIICEWRCVKVSGMRDKCARLSCQPRALAQLWMALWWGSGVRGAQQVGGGDGGDATPGSKQMPQPQPQPQPQGPGQGQGQGGRRGARPTGDPLTACLDADSTYICTAFSPRCFIIQKVSVSVPYGGPSLASAGPGGRAGRAPDPPCACAGPVKARNWQTATPTSGAAPKLRGVFDRRSGPRDVSVLCDASPITPVFARLSTRVPRFLTTTISSPNESAPGDVSPLDAPIVGDAARPRLINRRGPRSRCVVELGTTWRRA